MTYVFLRLIFPMEHVDTLQYSSDGNVLSAKSPLHTNITHEYSYDNNPNYLFPVIKALGNQPALVYFLLSKRISL